MANQVQIDKEIFDNLIDYFWSEDFPTWWLADEIRGKLESKLDKICLHGSCSLNINVLLRARSENRRVTRIPITRESPYHSERIPSGTMSYRPNDFSFSALLVVYSP